VDQNRLNKKYLVWLLLVIFYLVTRFGFSSQLDSFGQYASYIFEVVLVLIAIIISGRELLTFIKIPRVAILILPGSLLCGFFIFKLSGISNIQIPFELNGTETLLFLLVVAPILEELIFRFFIWQPVEKIMSKAGALIATSIVFSYSHLHAIWFVAKEIHPFILYQTAYTLILGASCGYFMYKYKSITGAILIHFAFNLGFYLGYVL